MLARVEESIREVKTAGSLNCNDHAVVEFVIWRNAGLAKISQCPKLPAAQGSAGWDLWESVTEGIGTEQSWQLFKDALLRVQWLSISQQNSSRRDR